MSRTLHFLTAQPPDLDRGVDAYELRDVDDGEPDMDFPRMCGDALGWARDVCAHPLTQCFRSHRWHIACAFRAMFCACEGSRGLGKPTLLTFLRRTHSLTHNKSVATPNPHSLAAGAAAH